MDSATKYRLAEIEMMKKNLETQLAHYNQTSAKFRRWHTRWKAVCGITGGVATILTGSGLGTSLSAVGIVVGVPLIATGLLFGLVSTSFIGTDKFFQRKVKKYKKMQTLVEDTLSSINSLISTTLEDGEISDSEYQDIEKKYNAFTTAKTKLQFSNHVDGKRRTSKTTPV